MKIIAIRVVVILIAIVVLTPKPASAISVELAKKCRAMALAAHPTTRTGVKHGTAAAERAFYNSCLEHNGTPPETESGQNAPPMAPARSPASVTPSTPAK